MTNVLFDFNIKNEPQMLCEFKVYICSLLKFKHYNRAPHKEP